jgi:dephospho-CoA kinase
LRLPASAGWLRSVEKKDNPIHLGITGGIASGKTTVCQMFEQLGAPLIDFDVLSREAVEPGKPAWKDIAAYFGRKVILADKSLDRKRLSEIVFCDEEKRKRLEGFIHPRILEDYAGLVNDYSANDPNIIIQAAVPLLFEVNLQYLFHKILLVYIPEEMQIERLIKRDAISRETAMNILKSQWPIEEKKDHSDFIVDNSGTMEATRRQVEEIWKKLKTLQKEGLS